MKQKFFALFFIFSLLLQGVPALVYANGNDTDGHKIAICHIPPGNPENMHTIEVDEHSVKLEAHLKHGDSIGPCATPPPPPPPLVNQPPVLTLTGGNPIEVTVGGTYVDQGAIAADPEDGNITGSIVLTGAVDTNTVGSYVLTYNVTDSQGLSATPVTRTVNVVSGGGSGGGGGGTPKQCSDGSDNDGDTLADFPNDPGCASSDDDDESDAAPTLTLIGDATVTLTQGGQFTDAGATANDLEDGDITGSIVVTGSVNTATVGTYTLTYNVTDSDGRSATPVTRTVNVVSAGGGGGGGGVPPQCADGSDNDGDTFADFPADPGCESSQDNDETNVPAGGGGGGGTPKQCSDGSDNDGDTLADFPNDPGCASSDDDDETNTSTPTGGGNGGGGGGGGGSGSPAQPPVPTTQTSGGVTIPTLLITNERLTSVDADTVTVTWTTNIPATSKVVYGDDPVTVLGTPPLYGYDKETSVDSALVTQHAVTVNGVSPNTPVHFRPVSSANGKTAVGIELTRGGVLGEEEGCFYLRDYLRLGMKNDPAEVTKLQTFLRDYEGFADLSVTGFFGPETDKAVRAFQDRYRDDVLVPWNLPANTGYVYYTTRKKVNEIYCARAFPLDEAQVSEIDAFRSFISALNVAKPKVAYAAGAETTATAANESASNVSIKDITETTQMSTTESASLDVTAETRGATLKDMLQARAGSAVVTSDANYFDEATEASLPHDANEATESDAAGEEQTSEKRSLKSIISVGLIFVFAVLIAG